MSLERYLRRENTFVANSVAAICTLKGLDYRNSRPKRILDLVISTPIFLLAIPLSAIISVAIKLQDGGPVFYTQERLKKDLQSFTTRKFRSMAVGADKDILGKQLSEKLPGEQDPRVNKIGQIIRATDVDELPQIWNVLSGDLTLVGLRSIPASEVEEMDEETRRSFLELYMQSSPGIINLKALFSKKPKDKKSRLSYDIIYARKASLGLDLFLVFKAGEKFVKSIKKNFTK